MDTAITFFSYSRADSAFVLKLAKDLREAGVTIWLDQLDIVPGSHWDSAIENALVSAPRMIVVLSPESVKSNNVMDEVSFALENGKTIIPILLSECETSFRLRRLQRIDFTTDYQQGMDHLLEVLGHERTNATATLPKRDQTATPQNVSEEKVRENNNHPLRGVNEIGRNANKTQDKKSSRKYIIGGAILVVAVIIILFLMHNSPNPPVSNSIAKSDSVEAKDSMMNKIPVNQVPDNEVLEIGEKLQGGIIFFIDSAGHHGLIAAPEDYNVKDTSSGLDFCKQLQTELATYKPGGFTDWRLPTIKELRLLYNARQNVPGLNLNAFPDVYGRIGFYTSAPNSGCEAIGKGFRSGSESYEAVNNGDNFRLIRSF
ncbi:MAG TPA: TIR domain-containing protein [Hanamia sp.]|nr:TIR domain-containing protein [Hanamia sp.]